MISLEEHLKYLKINKSDNTYLRTLKVSTHSLSFYTYALTIIAFFLELHPKIKLFLIILLIVNSLLGALVARKRINRIKKVLLIKDKNRLLFHEKMFHITIIITMILFFRLTKINKMDILFSSLVCFIILHIYNTIFDARIIYMDVLPKNKAIVVYTSLFFLLYSCVYFYTNN